MYSMLAYVRAVHLVFIHEPIYRGPQKIIYFRPDELKVTFWLQSSCVCVRARSRTSEVSVVTSAAAAADSAESRCIQPVWLLCTCRVVYCIGGAGGGLARRVAGRAVRAVVARVPHVRAALRRALLRVRAHLFPYPVSLSVTRTPAACEPSRALRALVDSC